MTRSVDILLASLIDYAGTFPPARLGLQQAAAEYARQRSAISHPWLGRFILAPSDLDAFEALVPMIEQEETPWPLAIAGKPEAMPDVARMQRFNRALHGRASIVAMELAPLPYSEIGARARMLPSDIDLFFEIPATSDIEQSVAAIAACGGRAKIRTGGVTPDAFPDARDVVAFIQRCHAARVPFKATAGLHHAVCGSYPLTYQPDSARTNMFGFLNVAMAAALIHAGAPAADALEALREHSGSALAFSDSAVTWRTYHVTLESLTDTRRDLFRSFGSCAFQEPVEELARLGVMAEAERSVER